MTPDLLNQTDTPIPDDVSAALAQNVIDIDPATSRRSRLRAAVRGAYDLQRLRIQTGLRLHANFRSKLGVPVDTKEEEMEKEAKKVLDLLRESYAKLTDGIANNRSLPNRRGFQGDGLISDYTELVLVKSFMDLTKVEKQQFAALDILLEEFPIWTDWLSNIRGIGPAMGAVLLSEIDIHKARYSSSLHALAGLDVVTKWKFVSADWETKVYGEPEPVIAYEDEVRYLIKDAEGGNGPVQVGAQTHWVEYQHGAEVDRTEENKPVRETVGILRIKSGEWVLRLEYHLQVLGGRSRRVEHQVKRTYVNKAGDVAERNSITFNPFLKTKLMGVLGTSFLRSASPYADIYHDIKVRYEVTHGDKSPEAWTKAHRHQAAIRYMVKIFLEDLYNAWRPMEGLIAHPPYREAKLGIYHRADGVQQAAE